jgi:hypothetical protein
MTQFYYMTAGQSGMYGNAVISSEDHHSLAMAKKHGLTRANKCGANVRYVAPANRFNNFLADLG